jgi:hypothetical protein
LTPRDAKNVLKFLRQELSCILPILKISSRTGKGQDPLKTTDLGVFCCNIFNHQDQLSTSGHGQLLQASAQNPTQGASLISQLLGFGPTKRQRSFDTTFQGTFTQSAVRGHGACCTKVQIGCFNSDLPAFGFKVWQSHTFTKWFATPLKEVRSQIAHGQL